MALPTALATVAASMISGTILTLAVFCQLAQASVAEAFGSLTVGGGLYLDRNQLESLPESFGSLTVGGELWVQPIRWLSSSTRTPSRASY